MRRRLAGRKHATQTMLVVVGLATTIASGTILGDELYARPIANLIGIALVLTAAGRQLIQLLEGETHTRRLQHEVQAGKAELAANEQRFRTLVETSSDVIWILDAAGVITFVTPSAERVLGFQPADCEGRVLSTFVHGDDRETVEITMAKATSTDEVVVAEWRMRRSDGEWAHCESTVRSLLDDPSIAGVVLNLRNITERKQLEQQLIRRALHDPLTGLANATLLRDRAELALARAKRGVSCALLLVDLDDFKAVNDGLGHAAGDQVLINVARRLVQAVRPGDTVARLGGDEFAVLLDGHNELAPEIVANRIQESLREPMLINGHEIFAPASIGLATSQTVTEAEALLRDADAAMYIAKGKGKSQTQVFRPEMHSRMKHRLTVATELRKAVSAGQLALRYQPIVDLKTSRVVGFEALVRWRHPERGLVMPNEFIPLAEDTGTIVALGRWVFEEACRVIAGLQSLQSANEPKLYVTVNLSARQFLDRHLVADLAAIAAESDAPATNITLELTESTLMDDVDSAIATLEALKRRGFRLALDDFGTGYSSLSYLKRLPLDILKIDKSFVRSLDTAQGEGMIQTILRLGETFDLKTLAEGIETEETRVQLRDLGCTFGQGFLFAEPMRRKEAQQLVTTQSRVGAAPFWDAQPLSPGGAESSAAAR